MLDQRSVLFVNSLEVPAGLQEAYVVFKWAVELEAFTGALNLQWAGWYRCMGVGLSINIIAHFGYILAIQNKVFVIWGARHSNILGTEQLINMAFRCIIPIPTQLTWCRKQAIGTFHQDCSSVTYRTVYSGAGEACHTLQIKKNNHPYSNRFLYFILND